MRTDLQNRLSIFLTGLIKMVVILCCLSFVGLSSASAQEVMKHPRVVELEDRLNRDAAAYIKARFPEVPFMVIVRVDPLRRESRTPNSSATESLPYFESFENDEEIRDEWDNSQVPLMALLNRVRKISVQISVPAQLKEAEVNEMRDGIFNILHLTPARDAIDVSRREWAMESVPWLGVYIAGAALFFLLIGLLVINRTSANRIARALTEMKVQNNGQSQSSGALAPMTIDSDTSGSKRSQSQEVKFNDPIKMKELASSLIGFLVNSGKFPNHHDMFVLDRLGQVAPDKLGGLLMEFPAAIQTELFKYSSGHHWVESLNEPGFLNFECLEALQALAQNTRDERSMKVKSAVLAVWRLGESRSKLLRTMPRDEAFALLSEMPKSIAVAEARKAFPGAWGAILDSNFKAKEIGEKRSQEIHDTAVMLEALADISEVKRYRSDKELLEYVKIADPVEEREIYEAASNDSLIHKFRPPFYPVFLQNEGVLKGFVGKIAIDRWSLALFNVLKSERQAIDKHLSEKQKFLMIERFKRFDQIAPSADTVGSAREFIGAQLKKYLKDLDTAKTQAGIEAEESEAGNEAA
jgi:hypothetical protein